MARKQDRQAPKAPPKNRPGNKLWSHVVGEKGVNRIRVYEIYEGSPIHVEWWDDAGRNKASFKKITGRTIRDKELAVRLAEKMAEGQAKARHAEVAERFLGVPRRRTLKELLDALHEAKWDGWKTSYRRDVIRFRKRWLQWLGEDTALQDITDALVERKVRTAAKREGWSPTTQLRHLRYIVDAFGWAVRRKWLEPKHALTAVEMPKVRSESKPYTSEEWTKLREECRNVDLRLWAIVEIAYATVSRLGAIRPLRVEDYSVEVHNGREVGVIQFGGETDKARRTGRVPIVGRAREAVELLLQMPAVQATGLLFPQGDLHDDTPDRGPMHGRYLTTLLHEAEKRAGVKEVKGRAFHGIKRRAVTDWGRKTRDMALVSKVSRTNRPTLEGTYDQDEMGAKVEAAWMMEGAG